MNSIIFGGTGFIGIHFAINLLSKGEDQYVTLIDKKDIESQFLFPEIEYAIKNGKLKVIIADVRDRAQLENIYIEGFVSLIANFAAIHREPGHDHNEYYKTNIPGAENICAFAEKIGCNTILFTSSIAVYEPNEEIKNENIIPSPISAYGGSKYAAELIHKSWQAKDFGKRKLVIIRPGVVYGPSEGGNVTRMIKAIKNGIFAFIGNKDTRKASIYVKELISIMDFLLEQKQQVILSNAVASQPPSMFEYVQTVKAVSGWKRWVPSVPYFSLLIVSYFVSAAYSLIGKKTGINPERIRKLRRVNNITSNVLVELGYEYKHSLNDAFMDWYKSNPADW